MFAFALIDFLSPFFNFLSPLCQPAASGVAAKASAVVALGDVVEGFTEGRETIHANACALNTEQKQLYLNLQANIRQNKEAKPEPVSGHTLQPDLRLHDI